MSSEHEPWSGEAIFARWAPDESLWSPWVKPVVFAEMQAAVLPPLPPDLHLQNVSFAPEPTTDAIAHDAGYRAAPERTRRHASDRTALVIDLPGLEAATLGLALIARGYRPVPLFNGAAARSFSGAPSALEAGRRITEIARTLASGVRLLDASALPADAPPAFLLDSLRTDSFPVPGSYDGRWIVFPQDFPSANKLRASGIERVIWRSAASAPDEDLAHVLRAWQQQGIALGSSRGDGPPAALEVSEPSRFRSLLRRAAVIAGLRRNSAGGFGGMVPVPTQSSGMG